MQWQKVFPVFILLCVITVVVLVLYQRITSVVIWIAPPQRDVIDQNVDAIDNGISQKVEDLLRNVSSIENKNTKNESKKVPSTPVVKILDNVRLNATKDGLPLLTIFTTLRDTPDRVHIHSNTLKNWAVFQPYIIPVLYTSNTDSELVQLAKKLGWEVLPVPKANSYGTPYLKPMYSMAKKKYKSVFYGYANGDLLFEYGLVDTLKSVTGCLDFLRRTMIIGRRTNVKVSNDMTIFKPEDVKKISKKQGKLFRLDAEDYFFIANSDFPWNKVPNVVVGRPAYDNFLVATAWKSGVSVVDATATLLALHQTGKDGDYAGHHNSKDTGHNYNVIGKFNYGVGLTKNAQFESKYGRNNDVEIWHRFSKADPRSYKVKSKIMQMISGKRDLNVNSKNSDNNKLMQQPTKISSTVEVPGYSSIKISQEKKAVEIFNLTNNIMNSDILVDSTVSKNKHNLALMGLLKSETNHKKE